MAACGRVLAERGWPVTILTKSSLVERDLDLWEEVNGKGGFLLMVSLMTLDEALRAVFEPSASPVEKRLEISLNLPPELPDHVVGDEFTDTLNAWSNKWTGFVESPEGLFSALSKQSLEPSLTQALTDRRSRAGPTS